MRRPMPGPNGNEGREPDASGCKDRCLSSGTMNDFSE